MNAASLNLIASTTIDVKDETGNPWYIKTDLNRDGLTDVVFYANSLRSWSPSIDIPPAAYVRVLEQQASGGFVDKTNQYIHGNRSSLMGVDLTAANFNKDFFLDFTLAGSGWDPYTDGKPAELEGWTPGEQDLFYTSGPDGKFTITDSQYASVWTHNVGVGDINNDGFDDVFSSSIVSGSDSSGTERSFLALSDGNGGFTIDQTRLPRLLVDQDAVTNWSGPQLSYVDQYGQTIKSGSTFTGSVLFDANHDGHVDLAVLPMSGTKTGLLFLNDGLGYYSNSRMTELPPGSFGYSGFNSEFKVKGTIQLEGKAADVDGDGDDDLLVLSTHHDDRDGKYEFYNGSALQVLQNDGQGNFTIAQDIQLVSPWIGNFKYYSNFEIIDVNRDGLPDVVASAPVYETQFSPTVILINNNGRYEDHTSKFIPTSGGLYMPFHNDGKLNLLKYEQLPYALDPRDGVTLSNAVFTHLESSSASGNRIAGSAHSELISGSSRTDIFLQSSGNDILDGLGGTDILHARGNRDDYHLEKQQQGWRLVDRNESSDSLSSVEYVVFDNEQLTRLTDTRTDYDANAVLRFYNTFSGTHFYTGSTPEAVTVLVSLPGFTFEGQAYRPADPSAADAVDVYRFYNAGTGTHFYTAGKDEADHVRATMPTLSFEGVTYQAHSSAAEGTAAVHRFYNPAKDTHFYTANQQEFEHVKVELAGVMSYDGIAYYVDV